MWALRRASVPLRSRTFSTVTFRASHAELGIASSCYTEKTGSSEYSPQTSDRPLLLKRFSSRARGNQGCFMGKHSFSSQAGAKSSGEEDDELEGGFSEVGASIVDVTEGKTGEGESDSELISEAELSESEEDDDIAIEGPEEELEVSDADKQKVSPKRSRASSGLFKAINESPPASLQKALDNWVEEGNDLTRQEISMAMLDLRRRRMYGKALQLSEWLESQEQVEFGERDYASRVDLIAKMRGLLKAENYIEKIPESFRGEIVYRTLLANCVLFRHMAKAEQVFKKMKDLNFPITAFACNQLLLLYKRSNKKKIADVLLLMEEKNIRPSLFTYRVLIDTKGQFNDIAGMEQIVETMKAEEMEPDDSIKAVLARHYAFGGLKEKAEVLLKEMEGSDLKEKRQICSLLLPIYAELGSADDVKRVWKVCKSNPRPKECMSAIDAWGRLKKVEEAEAVFEKMSKKWPKLSSKQYTVMLKVYANNNMLSKGKNLFKQMAESGCQVGPLTWDALVKLYIEAGEIEKADSILNKASQQKQIKPLFRTYMMILDQYAKKGDVHNAEKIFHRMREAGYTSRLQQYNSLLQTYVNAKAPAYGFRERMKADNVFPNKSLVGQLAQVDAFKKNAVSDLLD